MGSKRPQPAPIAKCPTCGGHLFPVERMGYPGELYGECEQIHRHAITPGMRQQWANLMRNRPISPPPPPRRDVVVTVRHGG